MKTRLRVWLPLFALSAFALPSQAEVGLLGWTPLVGFSATPDQFVVGTQLDFGDFVPHFHLFGNMDVGFGDDLTVVTAGPSIVFATDLEGAGTFYGGANFSVVYTNFDVPVGVDDDDTESEFGVAGQLGWLYPVGGNHLNVDLKFEIADYPDVKLMFGYRFDLTED